MTALIQQFQQFQQDIKDGYTIRPAINAHSDAISQTFVINAAVINDTIVPVPRVEAVLMLPLTLPEELALFASNFNESADCLRPVFEPTSSSDIRQLSKKQDEVYTGKITIEGVEYVCSMLFDGHGDNSCINAIRNRAEPVSALIEHCLDPIMAVHDTLEAARWKVRQTSGSTALYARLSATTACCSAVGDSFIYVFINGELAWKSTPHTMANPLERERHSHDNTIISRSDSYIKLLGETTVTQSPDGIRAVFTRHDLRLGPSMTLGHQNITGIAPEYWHTSFLPTDRVRIIGMSDGIHDMLYLDGLKDNIALRTMSAAELVNLANERYAQDWTIVHNGRDYPNVKIQPDQWDDCSAFVLANY